MADDDEALLPARYMAIVRVYLECATRTNNGDALFSTVVALPETDFAAGQHIRMATRRAMVLGHTGPYRVIAVCRLDCGIIRVDDVIARLHTLASAARADESPVSWPGVITPRGCAGHDETPTRQRRKQIG